MSALMDDELRRSLLTGELAGYGQQRGPAQSPRGQARSRRSTPRHPHIDAQLGLVDNMLQYFDRASMAHSLEVRVPFLDHEVVEYCARVPADLKVHRLTTKYLLKVAARDLVPERIVNKKKLGFFRGASAEWLRRQMAGPARDYLLASDPRYAEFIDRAAVADLVRRQSKVMTLGCTSCSRS